VSDRPDIADLVRRVEAMEDAISQMMGAFKTDLSALRADLMRLEGSIGPSPRLPPPPPRPPSRAREERPERHEQPAAAPRRTISEEVRATKKRDPRADD
jgi:hypothetical protein